MESLALDPGGYAGSYKLIGGRPSLDLVNTISWPHTERRHDWLAVPANVTAWLEAVGLPTMPIAEADLPVIHQIRGAVADMLVPLAHGETPPPTATERFNRHLRRAQAHLYIDPVDLDWAWTPPIAARDLLHPIVIDAADLITEGDRSRLKHCPSCDWIFEDQTRNGRRRWCDMADCGSRAKARSYYHRTKS